MMDKSHVDSDSGTLSGNSSYDSCECEESHSDYLKEVSHFISSNKKAEKKYCDFCFCPFYVHVAGQLEKKGYAFSPIFVKRVGRYHKTLRKRYLVCKEEGKHIDFFCKECYEFLLDSFSTFLRENKNVNPTVTSKPVVSMWLDTEEGFRVCNSHKHHDADTS